MFQEIKYWERLLFEIPHYAADTAAKAEDLRILKEHVLLVVRDYNRIIAALSIEERRSVAFVPTLVRPSCYRLLSFKYRIIPWAV